MKRFLRTVIAIDDDTLHRLQRLVRGSHRPLSHLVAEILHEYVSDARWSRAVSRRHHGTRQRRAA